MFEHDAEAQAWNAVHHPFTAPRDEDLPHLESDPGRCRAKAYDIVLNGIELAGAACVFTAPTCSRPFSGPEPDARGAGGEVRVSCSRP